MKKILKFYGLPHTGTNLLYWLLTVNFKEYVCNICSHNVEYLGWKHGVPMSNHVLESIEQQTGDKILFLFTERNLADWKEAILQRHQDSWEFLTRFKDSPILFFNTPMGFETYSNLEHLYRKKQFIYKNFCQKNPEISVMINFEDLQKDQTKVIREIHKKFGLQLSHEKPVEIHKNVDSVGKWGDFIDA